MRRDGPRCITHYSYLRSLTPPIPPPFPYTPLFRSMSTDTPLRTADTAPTAPVTRTRRTLGWDAAIIAVTDRKSTRLNSSHVRTSYAVFCLKKKTGHRVRSPARAGHDRRHARRILFF